MNYYDHSQYIRELVELIDDMRAGLRLPPLTIGIAPNGDFRVSVWKGRTRAVTMALLHEALLQVIAQLRKDLGSQLHTYSVPGEEAEQ